MTDMTAQIAIPPHKAEKFEEFTIARIYILGIPVMRKSQVRTIEPVTETKQTEEEEGA